MINVIQFLGQGTVASNKNTNTYDIMVYLPKNAPEASGSVRAANEEVTVEGVDANNNRVRVSSLRSNTVPAVWRAMGETNRVTAPDVREGTPVLIYTIAGTDKYYWTTWGMNLHTHRLETVIYGWSANPELGEDHDFDLDNYYTLLVSTHTGEVRLRTTDLNGEATTWDVNLNGKEGHLTIVGGNESIVSLDDVNRSFTYVNKDGSSLSIDKEDMFIKLPNSFNLEAGKSIKIFTQFMQVAIKEKLIVDCPETVWTGNITQKGNYDQEGYYSQVGDYTAQGNLTRNGMETISGSLTVGGGISSSKGARVGVRVKINGEYVNMEPVTKGAAAGGISGDGDLDIKGSATIKGDASIGGKSFLGHKHGNGNNGAPTTPPQ